MKKYRITFTPRYSDVKPYKIDVAAENSDEAFHIAYQTPEAKSRMYSELTCEEWPEGISNIGIRFRYTDTVFRKEFEGYLVIRAASEKDAVAYYNRHYKGNRFWFHCGEICEDGKCVYGKVVETYFAACSGFDADATKEEDHV